MMGQWAEAPTKQDIRRIQGHVMWCGELAEVCAQLLCRVCLSIAAAWSP